MYGGLQVPFGLAKFSQQDLGPAQEIISAGGAVLAEPCRPAASAACSQRSAAAWLPRWK